MKYRLVVENGEEPRCPICGHYNAMLMTGNNRDPIWTCRDCGFVVPERDVVFVEEER